jgi:hypothetical protein
LRRVAFAQKGCQGAVDDGLKMRCQTFDLNDPAAAHHRPQKSGKLRSVGYQARAYVYVSVE